MGVGILLKVFSAVVRPRVAQLTLGRLGVFAGIAIGLAWLFARAARFAILAAGNEGAEYYGDRGRYA
jgi:hypothetical protein